MVYNFHLINLYQHGEYLTEGIYEERFAIYSRKFTCVIKYFFINKHKAKLGTKDHKTRILKISRVITESKFALIAILR